MSAQRRNFAAPEGRPEDKSRDKANRKRIWAIGHSTLAAACGKRVAIMCAEKAWQNCHRGLIADHLKASGIEVLHILDIRQTELHPYTDATRFVDDALCYAADKPAQRRLDL
jgi:hypothetical protein